MGHFASCYSFSSLISLKAHTIGEFECESSAREYSMDNRKGVLRSGLTVRFQGGIACFVPSSPDVGCLEM
ncbi:hypothetical protein L1987_01213 [Smallanthus sonchifolius]|uniref:Uncharacterized protein n=1 Tax=Smallanthus sonchifolius TaxID=185202 RepID=A0ACB9K4E6_9ASTR|nr:hypothetical protein L1987_01213 [Smallanthus sonchifolius]